MDTSEIRNTILKLRNLLDDLIRQLNEYESSVVTEEEGPEGMLNSPNEIEDETPWHYRRDRRGC